MGLTNHKEDQLRVQPIIETKIWRSEKGNHIVFQTRITEIKPVAYVRKMLESPQEVEFEHELFAEAV